MKEWLKFGNRVGIFLALLFVLCFVWYWVRPVHQDLHRQLLEIAFIGYDGMNTLSFVLGLIQSYIWGFIGVALWQLSYLCCKCCGIEDSGRGRK